MSQFSVLLGGVLWICVFVGLFVIWQNRNDPAEAADEPPQTSATPDSDATDSAPADGKGSSEERSPALTVKFPARPLPPFEFDEVMGGKLSLDDLKGRRWVASFVFSRCTETCPTISSAMMRVHDKVKESAPDVLFVSFTVDPKHDTVDVFRQYSEIFTKGDHERWKFVTGNKEEIETTVVRGFGFYMKENVGETRLPGVEVAHSNRVALVNEEGIVVATFLGTREPDMVRLRRILSGKVEFPKPTPGLSFTRSDGSPLPIEVQAVPADDSNDGTDDSGASQNNPPDPARADESDPDNSDSAALGLAPEDEYDGRKPSNRGATTEGSTPEDFNAAIDASMPDWAKRLPAWNAGLNSLAAILLVNGLIAIRNQKRHLHRNLMIAAFLTSVVFLISYLTYHYALGKYTGEHGRRFSGTGVAAVVYQLILWPHIVLAAAVPVMAVQVFRHAFAERWDAHRSLAKLTFPTWMFVSVTGVIIYAMLYHWPANGTVH